MTPEQLVGCIDFRYITDALTPDEAVAILKRWEPTRSERIAHLQAEGYPAYTTSAGWLGYTDDKLRELCRRGMAEGWNCFKIKVASARRSAGIAA
jgi:L-fuconate dehydratase